MSKTNLYLSAAQLARLFSQLKQMESSGLPTFQAFAILAKADAQLKKPYANMQKQLAVGLPISTAGFKAGIFNETHEALIHAAETSGQLTTVYSQLANYYTALASRIKKVRSRLYLPALILMIALFVEPLPLLVTSQITAFTYLQLSLGHLLAIGLGGFLLLNLPKLVAALGMASAWQQVLLQLPWVANWIIKRQINQFLFILAMMLESGLAFAEALPKAVNSINNAGLRENFRASLKFLSTGASVADTLAKTAVINRNILQIVHSSEQSGKLASGLLHFSRLEADTIALQDDTLAEWLPRLIYGMIAVWMASSILGSKIGSVLPTI